MIVVVEMYVEFPKFQTGIFVQWQAPQPWTSLRSWGKTQKTGWNDIGERSEPSGCLGMGKGRRSLETCRILVSCSDWPSVFMVLLTVSRSFDVTFLLFGRLRSADAFPVVASLPPKNSNYSEKIQISLLDLAHPSAPRRETNIDLWSVRKRKTKPSKCGFFYILLWETTVTFLQSDWLITDV